MPSILQIFLCSAFALCGAAHAATFTATRFDDPAPTACLPTDCSLREAVLAANAAAGADRVALPAGLFTLSRIAAPAPGDVDGGTRRLVASDEIEFVGAGRDSTRIGAVLGIDGVLTAGAPGRFTVTLRDLSIEDTLVVSGAPITAEGGARLRLERVAMRHNVGNVGAIASLHGVTIVDSLFEGNTGAQGAVIIDYLGPTLIIGSEFRDNNANGEDGSMLVLGGDVPPVGERVVRGNVFVGNLVESDGGAVRLRASLGLHRLDLTDNTFEDNHAGGRGGALRVVADNAPPTARIEIDTSGSTFRNNAAAHCGAIAFDTPQTLLVPATLALDLARFEGNSASEHGGALCSSGTVTVARTTFDDNRAGVRGGAIHHAHGVLGIDQSTLSRSRAASGGAIAAYASVVLTRSTLDDNVATVIGGGLFLAGGGDNLLRHVTMTRNRAGNTAQSLRVVYGAEQTSLLIKDSILQGGCSLSEVAAIADGHDNIESPGHTCALSSQFNSVDATVAAIALGPLADNGGPTRTRLPQPGSIALNQIISVGGCGQIDQRGYKASDSLCDIGAVEASGAPVPLAVFADGFE